MRISMTPLLVGSILIFRQLVHAVAPSGYVIEWGRLDTITGASLPTKLVLSNTVAISAGRIQCLALKNDGTVSAWSWNRKGEITFDNVVLTTGEGGFTDETGSHVTHTNRAAIMTNGLVKINGQILNDVTSVAVGSQFGMGLKRDGTVIGWGENAVPIGPSNIVGITAAGFTSIAVKSDGTVIQWVGVKWFSEHGQLNVIPGLNSVVAVAMSENSQGTRNVALKKNGTVVHWGGESPYDDKTPPVGLSNVVAIAAGSNHTLALKGDGTITGWGFNNIGQATGVPTLNSSKIASGNVTIRGQVLSNVVSVAASREYSLALKNDGTVIAWGRIGSVPEGLSNVVCIAAGDNFCLAITTNSTVADRFH